MNNQKYFQIPPLLEKYKIIKDSKQKSDIFNKHFSSKSKVLDSDDEPPTLNPKNMLEPLQSFNTSSLEDLK